MCCTDMDIMPNAMFSSKCFFACISIFPILQHENCLLRQVIFKDRAYIVGMMQRGIKVLIASGILFLLSIIVFFVWGMSFSQVFVQNNPSVSTNQITLDPQESYNSSVTIDSASKLLTITVDSVNNDQILLRELVIDPNENILSNSTFQKTYFSTITPETTGVYQFSVTNMDRNEEASLYIFFGNLPFLKENGEIDLATFGGLVLGIILFISGLVTLVIGAILYIKDRNREKYRGFIPR